MAALAAPGSAVLPPAAQAAGPGSGTLTSLGTPLSDALLIGGTVAPDDDGRQVLWAAARQRLGRSTVDGLGQVSPGDTASRRSPSTGPVSFQTLTYTDGVVYVGTGQVGHLLALNPMMRENGADMRIKYNVIER